MLFELVSWLQSNLQQIVAPHIRVPQIVECALHYILFRSETHRLHSQTTIAAASQDEEEASG